MQPSKPSAGSQAAQADQEGMPQNIESLRAAPMAPPAIAVGAGVLLADNLPLPFWLWTLIALMALAGSLSASARTSWLCLLLALLSTAAAKQMLDTTPWS
ncbi:MAG: hypothetical protein FJ405_03370, partial [Verrucomicrobia bacterium]|nr:hypothetical protein [Verrucomicrobiota bacterium]